MVLPYNKKQLLERLEELLPDDLTGDPITYIYMAAEYISHSDRYLSQSGTGEKAEIKTALKIPKNTRYLLIFEPGKHE